MLRVDFTKRRAAFELKGEFELPEGVRALGIVGPSGGGKTTLLDCIAGVIHPDAGRIEVSGDVWFDSATGVCKPLRDRRVGYVFQDGLLFDHMSVRENLAYGARANKDRGEVERMASDLGIESLLDRSPRDASGGERRRIAIGRALLSDPRLLLLDEPLTGLDGVTAGRLLVYLRRVLQQRNVPALYVSHSPSDVMHVCERVIGISGGRVVHSGDVASVLSVSACTGPRELSELRSIVDVRLVETDESERASIFETERGVRIVALGGADLSKTARRCAVAIFARDVVLGSNAPQSISARNVYAGRVRRIEKTPTMAVLEVDIGFALFTEVGYGALREMSLAEGSEVFAYFKASAVQRLL
ncbi:MAG: molybdenum ABC transporter ATP-binding protein [Phycisphaerales bacterium]|nr:molybdenum ABC transporter ATP-binding protein [Phycisphaerales bacterium]MCB9857005.1 molybdenum ABC transporter ATP-binding protein [Phycisphaerales bacterium]MCB9861868.1 molybdenum ABC transporter ATP-binding protein [Phycisphaerales bacterium]